MLKDKVAFITGAASGIGEACAASFAREGAKVMLSDIDEDNLARVTKDLKSKGASVKMTLTDVGDAAACEKLAKDTVAAFGRLDIAVNNAGISGPQAPAGDYPIDGWNKVIDINLNGVYYCMRAAIQAMGDQGGSIINMASILGQVGFRAAPAYVAAKHGVVGMTRAAALDHAAQGIRINAVGPAFINTPLLKALDDQPDVKNMLVSLHPAGRLGEANEVAELVTFLSSDRASFLTGNYYPVDGGYLSQ